MTTWQLLASTWSLDAAVLVGCAGLLILGFGFWILEPSSIQNPSTRKRAPEIQNLSFMLGVLVLLLALVSPIDTLGDTYLFSAHMLQHLLLVLVVPPLLLLGTPRWVFERVLRWRPAAIVERALRQPAVAWLLGTGAVWVWHVPALYNAALDSEGVHIGQHLCFLVTATIFWWPVLSPLDGHGLEPVVAIIYLFAAAFASSVLGIVLTFAGPGLYPAYLHPEGDPAVLSLVRNDWGISPAGDQQLGGLLMWVPGSLVYLASIMAVFARWYSLPDEDGRIGNEDDRRLTTDDRIMHEM